MVKLYGSIRSVIDPEKQRVELKDTWPTAALHIIWRRGRGGGISLHCPHTRSLAPRTITFPQYSFTQPQGYSTPSNSHWCAIGAGGKHCVLGLPGCALLIGVLIEGITNTYWVQIPSVTIFTCTGISILMIHETPWLHIWLQFNINSTMIKEVQSKIDVTSYFEETGSFNLVSLYLT